jgi:GDP-4-dehydro-6-deoxy-D-mannose reductase
MRVLVTGASGFVGRHLVADLVRSGVDVLAADCSGCEAAGGARRVRVDVCDRDGIRALVTDGIDTIYHLAFSRVRPGLMTQTALEGTAVLLEEASHARQPPRVLLVSSAAVYGFSSGPTPLTEDAPALPATYYGVIKRALEMLAATYARLGTLHVVTVRPFNLVGPGEDGTLVTGALAFQIARGERGGARFDVQVGNIEAYRDYIDVRDAVRGFAMAACYGQPGEVFNVCTDTAVQVRSVVEFLRRASPVSFALTQRAVVEGGRDIPYQVGSAARLRERSGWKPELTLEQSLRDLLNYARERAEADAA